MLYAKAFAPFVGLLSLSNLVNCVPVDAASTLLSSSTDNTTLNRAPEILCDDHLGGKQTLTPPIARDCEAAIALIPRDPRGHPVDRNFYIAESDISDALPNVATPITKTVG